jgi:hypothetical protein
VHFYVKKRIFYNFSYENNGVIEVLQVGKLSYKDKKNYYYDTSINPFKRIVGNILLKYISFQMKDLEPK